MLEERIRKDKLAAISGLKSGLEGLCADDLTEVLINLEGGTCDYVELIPLLEKVAEADTFYYFDENGAGGFPRADLRQRSSFRQWALKSIENIRENARFEADGEIPRALKSNNNEIIKDVLKRITSGECVDKKLIPILEKIARKNFYGSYSYYSGFNLKELQFGELARQAIETILENSEK